MLKSNELGSNHKRANIHMEIRNDSTKTKTIHHKSKNLGKECVHKMHIHSPKPYILCL